MKLLIVTQKVNKNDPILGFFHRWIEEFSKHVEKLTVICLEEGEHDLPRNVTILSLGKERHVSKLTYVARFYRYIWTKRNDYDVVFVHMNQEYVLLGGLLWKMLKKKVAMWRNHPRGGLLTDIAVHLSSKVFCTSEHSYTTKFKKTKIMPAGIDTELYKSSIARVPNSVLFFGRLSKIKKVDKFINALLLMRKDRVNFKADIVGSASTQDDALYESKMKKAGGPLVRDRVLAFKPAIKHKETSALYGQYSLYVNLTPDGSLDKTILEAMAAKTPVLVSNKSFYGEIPDVCVLESASAGEIKEKMAYLLSLNEEERKMLGEDLHGYVSGKHSLKMLVDETVVQLAAI